MASKKRFAAKWIVATTVLAAGGAGVYSYTAGNAAPWAWLTGSDSGQLSDAKLTADKQRQSRGGRSSDLDAVASAWAENASSNTVTPADASHSARSAGITLARAESEASSLIGSRYGDIQPSPVAAGQSPSGTAAAQSERGDANTTTIALEPIANLVAAEKAEVGRPAEEITPVGPTIVRGQDAIETKDQAPPPFTQSGDSKTKVDAAVDPVAIQFPADGATNAPSRGAAVARARQAFNEQPAGGADRYGATPAAARSSDSNAGRSGGLVNPFGAISSQPPISSAAEPRAAQNISPLPPPANGATEIASGNRIANDRAPESGQFAPVDFRGSNSAYGGQAGLPPASAIAPIGGDAFVPGAANGNGPEGSGRPGERALEGAQNPSLVIQKVAPAEVQVNKPAKFLIQVRNVGGQAAADVVIQDQVPKGTRLLTTSPPAEESGGKLVWRVGTLSIGEERSIEMQLMPVAEGEIGSVATVSYSAQASVKTRSTMPQLAIRMTSPKQVMVGQEHRVKIFLHNPGTGDATGVMLFETVPENVRHAAGAALEFEIGTLRAGETRELELLLLAEKPGKVTNILSARAEGNLQVQHHVDFEVIAPALTVAVVGPERRYLERAATYAVRVENPGTAPARDIQLVTKLPKGMKFVRANNMGEYDAGSHAVYWSLAELPEGEHGSVELVAMPIETGPQTLEVEGRAQQGLSDQAKHPIIVEGLAAIMFEVRDLEDPIEVGRETGYEIRVINQGTKAATNVQVAVALPQGMQVISAEGETRHTVQANSLVFAPIRQLAPKADTVYRVKVLCQTPGDQRVTVEVKTDDMQPIRREESTRVFGDQ